MCWMTRIVAAAVAIYVNGDRIADRDPLTDAVDEADEVFVFQALSGG